MHIMRRIIDKGGAYYPLISDPTDVHLFRIMSSIAVKKTDVFKEVLIPDLVPDSENINYIGSVTSIEHDDGSLAYRVFVDRDYTWDIGNDYYVFINHNAYQLDSIMDRFSFNAGINPLYVLIRDAEIYRKQDILTIGTGATVWSTTSGTRPTICFRPDYSSFSYEIRELESNTHNFKDIPKEIAHKDYSSWHELTRTTEICTAYSNKNLWIENYMGIAFTDANSTYAPKYINYTVYDEADNRLYHVKIETGISDIIYSTLPTYKLDKRILWHSFLNGGIWYHSENYDAGTSSSPGDFGLIYKNLPNYIDLRLTRVRMRYKMPLLFTEPIKFIIKDYAPALFDGGANVRLMSYAATNYLRPWSSNRQDYYIGYYGRDIQQGAAGTGLSKIDPNFTNKSFSGHLIIPPYLDRTIISPDELVHRAIVSESGRNVIFNFTNMVTYLLEDDDSDNDRDLPIRMCNRAIYHYGVNNIAIKSYYIEMLYLLNETDLDERRIYFYDNELYYKVMDTTLAGILDSTGLIFSTVDELPETSGEVLIDGVRLSYKYTGTPWEYDIESDRDPLGRVHLPAGSNVTALYRLMVKRVNIGEILADITDTDDLYDFSGDDYYLDAAYASNHYIVIDQEVMEVEHNAGSMFDVLNRGCRGTLASNHEANSDVLIYDYLTLDPADVIAPGILRLTPNILAEYDGEYKSRITLTKHAMEPDIHNSYRVYVVEIVWQ